MSHACLMHLFALSVCTKCTRQSLGCRSQAEDKVCSCVSCLRLDREGTRTLKIVTLSPPEKTLSVSTYLQRQQH